MSKLLSHVEEMRMRLTEIAASEQTLVKALGDALTKMDAQLLADVRRVTAAHEIRRTEILGELQLLAGRIGAFPVDPEPIGALTEAAPTPQIAHGAHQHNGPTAHHHAHNGHHHPLHNGHAHLPHGGADWRQAASNIEDDDLDFPVHMRHRSSH